MVCFFALYSQYQANVETEKNLNLVRAMIMQLDQKISLAFETDSDSFAKGLKAARKELASLSKEERKILVLLSKQAVTANE